MYDKIHYNKIIIIIIIIIIDLKYKKKKKVKRKVYQNSRVRNINRDRARPAM